MSTEHRLPTLDGWRGIAILMVMFTHALNSHTALLPAHPWLDLGRHGVGIFFVLSGYLITTRLLQEEKINLGSFYVRRLFRLMPAAWTYLLVVALIGALSGLHLIGADAFACVFFFRNYWPVTETPHNALTSHFWSLSIEEQFYLSWPVFLSLTGPKRALQIAIVGCAGYAVYLSVFAHRLLHDLNSGDTWTQFNVGGLLIGCTLALICQIAAVRAALIRFHDLVVVICGASLIWHISRFHLIVPLSESISIALLIGATSALPQKPISRVLEWRALSICGLLSYSLYVWQEFFLLPHWNPVFDLLLPVTAIFSWNFIEQPGIRLGRKLAARIDARGKIRALQS